MFELLKAHKTEESPYRSFNELSEKWEKYCHEVTTVLFSSICKTLNIRNRKRRLEKAEKDPLIFKGRIQYNPQTGKPISIEEWKKLESAIIKYLGGEKDIIQKKMVEESFWLGSMINRLNDTQKKKMPLKNVDFEAVDFNTFDFNDYDMDRIAVEEQLSGIYLQNITDRARSKVQEIIVNGTREGKPKYRIWQDLWDQEEDINRDWDRVIRTETSYGETNGLLISQLRMEPEEEYIYMKGISAPGACPSCIRLIHDKVVVLRDSDEKDKITIDGKEYQVIWPGKSNYGRSVRNYWSCIPLHPYCRCVWSRWYPELEKYLGGRK